MCVGQRLAARSASPRYTVQLYFKPQTPNLQTPGPNLEASRTMKVHIYIDIYTVDTLNTPWDTLCLMSVPVGIVVQESANKFIFNASRPQRRRSTSQHPEILVLFAYVQQQYPRHCLRTSFTSDKHTETSDRILLCLCLVISLSLSLSRLLYFPKCFYPYIHTDIHTYSNTHKHMLLCVFMYVRISIYLSIYLLIYLSIYLTIYLSIYLSIHTCICICVCIQATAHDTDSTCLSGLFSRDLIRATVQLRHKRNTKTNYLHDPTKYSIVP